MVWGFDKWVNGSRPVVSFDVIEICMIYSSLSQKRTWEHETLKSCSKQKIQNPFKNRIKSSCFVFANPTVQRVRRRGMKSYNRRLLHSQGRGSQGLPMVGPWAHASMGRTVYLPTDPSYSSIDGGFTPRVGEDFLAILTNMGLKWVVNNHQLVHERLVFMGSINRQIYQSHG